MNRHFNIHRTCLLFACFFLSGSPVEALACSKHGTNAGSEIKVMYGGDADGDGKLLMTVGIEDQLVEPAASTTCVTGIGLGSSDWSLPAGVEATSARIDRVNRVTGEASRVENFRFAADAETTAGMASGGGSGIGDPRPGWNHGGSIHGL